MKRLGVLALAAGILFAAGFGLVMVASIFTLPASRADGQVEPPQMQQPQKVRSGIIRDKITNVPQVMMGPLPTKTVTYCLLVGGAADEVVTLRPIGGGSPQVNIAVPAGATVGKEFNAEVPKAGFEVLTQTPAGDVTVQCLFIPGLPSP